MSRIQRIRITRDELSRWATTLTSFQPMNNEDLYFTLLHNGFAADDVHDWIMYRTNPGPAQTERLRQLLHAQRRLSAFAAASARPPEDQATRLRRIAHENLVRQLGYDPNTPTPVDSPAARATLHSASGSNEA